jgi:hypothetical protein
MDTHGGLVTSASQWSGVRSVTGLRPVWPCEPLAVDHPEATRREGAVGGRTSIVPDEAIFGSQESYPPGTWNVPDLLDPSPRPRLRKPGSRRRLVPSWEFPLR